MKSPISTEPLVMATADWPSNAEMIADVAKLGYLRREWLTLDPTYGNGVFWKVWRPDTLVGCDLELAKSPLGWSVDFRELPWVDRFYDAVVFDPPYKLNGTPSEPDEPYGVHVATPWRDRMDLCYAGIRECARVSNRMLLVKCQDQVCSGKVRWQTLVFTAIAEAAGFGLIDRFDILSYRAQPEGTSQVHARRNSSTLLVFKRGHKSS